VKEGGRLARALRLRCPWCGEGRLFARWFRMHERCGGCGLKFEREAGYFLGSIYVNYGVAVVLALALHLPMQYAWHVRTQLQAIVLGALAAGFGLVFFRWARALWLAFDVAVDPPEAHEFVPARREEPASSGRKT
jgi:uncharacterized protein (DUF983 family)